jgi:hypothetical protein
MITMQRTGVVGPSSPGRGPGPAPKPAYRRLRHAGARSTRLLPRPALAAAASLLSAVRELLLVIWALAALAFWIAILAAWLM